MKFVGRSGDLCLFSADNTSVIINETDNLVVSVGDTSELSMVSVWSDEISPSNNVVELANASLTSLDITVLSNSDRMYTIPKSVQNEAKRALEWHKEHHRGGTPVGLNTARTLAKGGQIGIQKVRHIAKYFPRHEVDKKGKGYKFGSEGFPSNGRIAWALWGGDAAYSWASVIVERENKKTVTASIYKEVSLVDLSHFDNSSDAEFTIRVRADGSGIDRLYMTNPEGDVFVWDDGTFSNLGESSTNFSDYDFTLDGEPDGIIRYHFPVDSEAALLASALLDSAPYGSTSVENINITEAELALAALPEVEWNYIDSLTFSDAPAEGDGKYTTEERSKNVEGQVRDATGKFAKMGSPAVINGNYVGKVMKAHADRGTLEIQADNGNTFEAPANTVDAQPETQGVAPGAVDASARRYGQPLDVSGILGEPRDSTNKSLAGLPNRLPPLTKDDMQSMLTDWGSWVADQRTAYAKTAKDTPQVHVNTDAEDHKAPNAYNDPYLRSWLDTKYKGGGKTNYPNRSWYNPMRTDDVDKKKSASSVGSKGPSGSGSGSSWNSSWSKTMKDGVVKTSRHRSSNSIIAAGESQALTPETSDVPPIYMAIVAQDDPQAVMDLVALIPASTTSTEAATFSRKNNKWVQDNQILNDLSSPTPPPVIVLDDETLKDVLSQIDDKAVTASIDKSLSVLWGPTGDLLAVVAAGGVDKNRGNAEKLRRYWTVGKGGAKIRWGTGGDWTRCVRHLSKYLGTRAKGYCALRHKEMTGLWTGDKAHRQKYGTRQGLSIYSNQFIVSTQEVVDFAELTAQANNAKKRITASGSPISEGARFSIPLVLPEKIESGDGRSFTEGSITMRDLPLPLMWQIKTAQGHDGSVVVGRIDKMERIDVGVGNAYGVFDSGEYGREAERLVRGGFIKGISADLDRFEASDIEENSTEEDEGKIGGSKIKITKGRIMGITLVPKPAFQECKIYIEDNNETDNQEEPVLQDGEYVEEPADTDAEALVACATVVASIPVTPPSAWFDNPKLNAPTPLSVTDDGRVFGHIAAWHVDHIGMSFGTKPPRSKSQYAYFHTGIIRTEEGKDVPVGQLTLAGGHASLEASARAAAKHYDDTASAFADVHAGEDAYGIWVSGALRPSITPEQVRAIRASAPSGDWRPIQGALELVAVCQVNVPGFPIARARVASGEVMALVAAGARVLAEMKSDPVKELANRIERLEQAKDNSSLLFAMEEVKSRFSSLKGEYIVSEEPIVADAGCGCCSACTSMCQGSCCANCGMEANSVQPLLVDVLQKLLSDTVSFYFRAHGYHWNVKGSDFSEYHELFGEIYEDTYGSIDPLGENIVKLGFDAPFNLRDFDALRSIDDSNAQSFGALGLAYDLHEANDALIAELKSAFDAANAGNEQGIANFLAERIDNHQKWAWQLKASLVPDDMEMPEDDSDEQFFVTVFSTLDDRGLLATAGGPSEEVRKELAKKGEALSDGSYPIRNVAELKKAIHAYGRSKPSDRTKVRRHIEKRARSLKKPELIPNEWKSLSSTGMGLSIAVADLRSRIASNAITAAGEVGGVDPKALTPDGVSEPLSSVVEAPKEASKPALTEAEIRKYTAKTQPRDGQGRFRDVLARLKQDLGVASLNSVAEKVKEVQNLDNTGNYAESAKAAANLVDTLNRLDTGALDSKSAQGIKLGTAALAKSISNLPLPFDNQAQKIRFSDMPPVLRNLMKDMADRVVQKIGQKDGNVATEKVRDFMSGGRVFSQSDISSEMNVLLRLLT